MNGKDFKIGDSVFYFDGRARPERATVTKIIDTQFEGFDIVEISKKHVVTGKDLAVCDFYLYKTVEDVKYAVSWHVEVLASWKCEEE